MRVALLASIFALLAGTPAFAQCVYVACNGGGQTAPVYQQPVYQAPAYQGPAYQAPSAAPRSAPGYDEGYAAGLAARSAAQSHARPAVRTTRPAATRSLAARRNTGSYAMRTGTGYARSTGAGVGRGTSGSGHRAVASTNVRRHAAPSSPRTVASAPRRAAPRVAISNRATNTQHAARQRTHSSNYGGSYQDPIKDRAGTYRPAVYGASTSMASLMSRSGSYSATTTTWTGPATLVNQGGQVCGWGARIVTNGHGYAQRQAVWVCQCPQGWRPPGY
jgi:hypothetical protein